MLRFVSSVSDLVRQKELDNVLRASIPLATHQQQARKAARDLIENLSLHGSGMAFYAAQELSKQVNEIILFGRIEKRKGLDRFLQAVIDVSTKTEKKFVVHCPLVIVFHS